MEMRDSTKMKDLMDNIVCDVHQTLESTQCVETKTKIPRLQ